MRCRYYGLFRNDAFGHRGKYCGRPKAGGSGRVQAWPSVWNIVDTSASRLSLPAQTTNWKA